MKTTFSISFICRKSKVNKGGYAPVEMSIIQCGERVYLTLPMRERPEVFEKAMKSRKVNEMQRYCNEVNSRVQGYICDLMEMGCAINPQVIKNYIQKGYSNVYTVGMLFEDYFSILRKKVGVSLNMGNYRKYEMTRDMLLRYVKACDSVDAITNSIILNIETELKCKYKGSTVANYMTKLKSIVKYAIDNGKLKVSPFIGVKISKKEAEIVILSDLEYMKMRDYDFSYCERLEKVRDLFVLACNCGLSYCDIVGLNKDDFKVVDGRVVIEKERQKTGVRFYSVVLEDGVSILEKYGYDLSSLYLSNQKVNSYAKEIQDICGVTSVDSLHFHLCRHYYISKLVRVGIPIAIVQRCAGHSSVRMTNRYTHLNMEDVVGQVSMRI